MLMILNIITWIINLIMVILAVIMYKRYETISITSIILLFMCYTFEIMRNIIGV